MPNPPLAGFAHDSAGDGVASISVNVYQAGDTMTKLSSATTGADGSWSIANSSVQNPDIELVNGTEITRFKYADKVALTGIHAESYGLRNDTATSSFSITLNPATLTADRTYAYPDIGVGDTAGTIIVDGDSTGSSAFYRAATTGVGTFTPRTFRSTGAATDSQAVLTTDTGLAFSVGAGLVYRIHGVLLFNIESSQGDPCIKISGVGGNAAVDGVAHWHDGDLTSDSVKAWQFTEASTVVTNVVDTGVHAISFAATVQGNAADTVRVEFRQSSANGSATTLNQSWMTVQRYS